MSINYTSETHMSYTLHITESDLETIGWVGHRYEWSDWADKHLTAGDNVLAEHEAWEFAEAIDADTDGNHAPFPLLDQRSDLYKKLQEFYESLV